MRLSKLVGFTVGHLYNKRKVFFLTTIIILISIIMVLEVVSVYMYSYYEINEVHDMFGNGRKNMYKLESDYAVADFNYFEKYNECIQEIREKYDIAIYDNGLIYPRGTDYGDKIDYVINNAKEPEVVMSGLPMLIKLDEKFIKGAEIEDEKGNIVKLGEYDGKREAAIGSFYKDIIPVGTVFTGIDESQEYIVTCVLKDGQKWLDGAVYSGGSMISLEECILTTPDMDYYRGADAMTYSNSVYLFYDGTDISEIKSDIQNIAEKYGVFCSLESFAEYESEYKQTNHDMYFFSLVLAVVLIASAVVIVTVMSLVGWLKDFHNIGILMTNGFTYKDVRKMILIENTLSLIISVLFSYAWFILKKTNAAYPEGMFVQVFSATAMIFILCMMAASVVTYLQIKKRNPIVLLKGER